jgi:dimethylargininase
MLRAFTRAVPPNMGRCELTYRDREPISHDRAAGQHAEYCGLLRHRGAEVTTLAASARHPDCCFVEDAAVVVGGVAVFAAMGAASRRGEQRAVEAALGRFCETRRLPAPATIDGGDVVKVGRKVFVGLSRRTNAAGFEALARVAAERGYEAAAVNVGRCLHLTTACGVVDEETLIVNPRWVDTSAFRGMRVLAVPEDEPWAANTLRVGGAVCVEAGAPRTLELVSGHHADVEVLDISEFRKAEGSLSCLSIIFETEG